MFASTNRNKWNEYNDLLKPLTQLKLVMADEMIRNADKIGLVETHNSYLDNAIAKARLVNQGCHHPSLGDDSGLEVDALSNRPGVRSRRYAIPKSGQSQDQANIEKILNELKGRPFEARKARFITSLALVIDGILIHANGVLEGRIAEAPMGEGGFGYDSVFVPEGKTVTLAQISMRNKNELSHRSRAIHALLKEINAKGIILAKP
ncbi:MAG: non-canonical purine NTP pyrophosphatase [Xanthomonadaceae bacterium]|nr:non-canonical purine NTP pyrophosphatase [Xanthomonadaceae bacterium]